MNKHPNFANAAKLAVIIHKDGRVSTHKSITKACRLIGIEPDQGHDIVRGRKPIPKQVDCLSLTRHPIEKIEVNDVQFETDRALSIFNKVFEHYVSESEINHAPSNKFGPTGPVGKYVGWTIVLDDGSTIPADTGDEIAELFGTVLAAVSQWSRGVRGIPRELGVSAIIRNGQPNRSWVSKRQPKRQWI